MNPIRHTRRAIAILAGLAATALAAFGAGIHGIRDRT